MYGTTGEVREGEREKARERGGREERELSVHYLYTGGWMKLIKQHRCLLVMKMDAQVSTMQPGWVRFQYFFVLMYN